VAKKKTSNKNISKSIFQTHKGMILLIFVAIITLLGFLYINPNNSKEQSPIQTVSHEDGKNDISDWREYVSTDKTFTFKYPENLVYAYTSFGTDGKIYENSPHFFNSQVEADEAVNCITNGLGTLEKSCSSGLFDVADVTKFQESAKQPMQDYLDSKDPSLLSELYIYSDSQGRKWIVRKPIYGLGGTQTDAETMDGKKYQVQIHIWDDFIDASKPGAAEKQIDFVNSLLNTFKFSY